MLSKQVKELIIQRLASGKWRPGDKLPVEAELAKLFSVGISTVRAAVGELDEAGILIRRQGKGTFVADHADRHRLYRFLYLIDEEGTRVTPVRETLQLYREDASRQIAKALELTRYKDQQVFRIRYLLKVHGVRIGVGDAFVPAHLFPRLTLEAISDGSITLYGVYQSLYNMNVVRVVADVCADVVKPADARALRLSAGSPVLLMKRRAYGFGDLPIEFRTVSVSTGGLQYRIEQGSTV